MKMIEEIKRHNKAIDIWKKYKLNEVLGTELILLHFNKGSIKEFCQNKGLHQSTCRFYFRMFNSFLQSEYSYLIGFYFGFKNLCGNSFD